MKIFKFIALFMLFSMVFAATSVVSEANPSARIAIVFSTGGLGDLSFNDAANLGKNNAKTDFGSITVDQTEPSDITEITSAIESYASAETPYDLIIGIGFTATDGINASALAHKDVNFMIVDSVVDLPNVASVVFAEHEGSFLAGAMAAMVTESDDIAFLGGLDIPLINKFLAGYEAGAKYINPKITVRSTYSPNPDNPWGDLAGGKDVANDFISQGSDIIYAAAGGTGLGVFDAAAEATTGDKKVYAIGVDSNQDHLKEGIVLTSMIKRVDVAVYNQIEAVVKGTWAAGFTQLGLKEDGVGITDMEFTQTEAKVEYETGVTRLDKIAEIKADIISGKIVVPSEITADEGGLPFPAFAFFLSLIAIPVIVRRRK